jgi:hypothetical protein
VCQFLLRDPALPLIVAGNGSNEDVGIGRDFHRLPAQPRAAISLISSIDKDGPFPLFPNAEDIRDLAGRPHGLHFDPTIGLLLYGNSLARAYAQML